MGPRPDDTPPASPNPLEDGNGGLEEEEILAEGDAMQIIDLDEMMEGGEGEDEDEMEDGDLAPPPEDNSVIVFQKHQKAVFSGDFHPRLNGVCVSGGEDDRAYVWTWKKGDGRAAAAGEEGEITIVHGESEDPFKDSVVFVRFNKDGTLLALADMAGNIKVRRVSSESDGSVVVSKEVVWEFETGDITWLEWHPGANVLFATTDGSELWMWKIPSGDSKVYLGNGEKAEGAVIMPDGKRVAVGYGDGSIKVFDLKSGDVVHSLTDASTSHSPSAVTALAAKDNLLATGGADGVAKVFNVQSGKNIATFVHGNRGSGRNAERSASTSAAAEGAEGGDASSESSERGESTVESILFNSADTNNLTLLTGTLDGNVSVWDVSSHVKRHTVNVGDGVVKMSWRKGSTSNQQLFVATLDGKVSVVDPRSGRVVGECSGHREAVLDFAQTSDGQFVMTCSDDSECRVFDVNKITNSAASDSA